MSLTTNLADFGYREIKIARDLLDAWVEHGLPEDFEEDGVEIAMNMDSGYVFLTNSEYQVAMEEDGRLVSFYSSPYEGHEGTIDGMLFENDIVEWHEDDKEWISDLVDNYGSDEQKEKLKELLTKKKDNG